MRSRFMMLIVAGLITAGCNDAPTPPPAPRPTEPKPPTPKKEEPKKEEPKKEQPKKEEPKKSEPAKKDDSANAGPYGTIKGQIVWGEKNVPAARMLDINKDQGHCGLKIASDELIIDAKTKGVQNVMIWLDSAKMDGVIANIHPSLAALPKEPATIDQPQCLFVPRITMMREGQILVVKNSAAIAHNSKIIGRNFTKNPLIPPKSETEVKDLKAESRPYLLGCDIHGWMAGRIGVFKHPYFTLSAADGKFEIKNVPAGKLQLFMVHEVTGYVHKGGKKGQAIEIKPGGTLDLGKIEMKNIE